MTTQVAINKDKFKLEKRVAFWHATWLALSTLKESEGNNVLVIDEGIDILNMNEARTAFAFSVRLAPEWESLEEALSWASEQLVLPPPMSWQQFNQPLTAVLPNQPNLLNLRTLWLCVHQQPTFDITIMTSDAPHTENEMHPSDLEIVQELLPWGSRTCVLTKQVMDTKIGVTFLLPHQERDPVRVEFPLWLCARGRHDELFTYLLALLLNDYEGLSQYFPLRDKRTTMWRQYYKL